MKMVKIIPFHLICNSINLTTENLTKLGEFRLPSISSSILHRLKENIAPLLSMATTYLLHIK